MVRNSPGLEDFWQIHYQTGGGPENNVPERFIANLSAQNCPGYWLKLSARLDGGFSCCQPPQQLHEGIQGPQIAPLPDGRGSERGARVRSSYTEPRPSGSGPRQAVYASMWWRKMSFIASLYLERASDSCTISALGRGLKALASFTFSSKYSSLGLPITAVAMGSESV